MTRLVVVQRPVLRYAVSRGEMVCRGESWILASGFWRGWEVRDRLSFVRSQMLEGCEGVVMEVW